LTLASGGLLHLRQALDEHLIRRLAVHHTALMRAPGLDGRVLDALQLQEQLMEVVIRPVA